MAFSGKPVLGIAGGIGSGKSTVAKLLGELGCLVVDSDKLAHEALRDSTIRKTIIEWWGDSVIDQSTGEVSHKAVAAIVFSNPDERKRLEGLTHPWIETRRKELFGQAKQDNLAFVIDAPLLFEAGLDSECDSVIFVDSQRSSRLDRNRSSRGWSEKEFTSREAAQLPLDIKQSRADYVIENNGDLDQLRNEVSQVFQSIMDNFK